MHRALQIPELVQLVCAKLYPRFPRASALQSLYSLAQVCRIFSAFALDCLWARQDTLVNILLCMPADLWEVNGSGRQRRLRARRAIEPADWTRFHVYAHRIKSFSFSDHDDPTHDAWSPVFEMLSAAIDTQHIFPNLQALMWIVRGSNSWFCQVRLLLCPRIKTLMLGVLETPAHLALLPTLPKRCPLLVSVTLTTVPQFHVNCRPRSLMVCGMIFLERLTVASIDQSAFEHLSQLPTLKSLTLQNTPNFFPSRAADSSRFPKLCTLTLRQISHDFLTAFIEMNDVWSFVQLTAYMTSTPTATATARLYALIGAKCDPTILSTLTLAVPDSSPEFLPVDLLARGIHVFLVPVGGFSLDDTSIETLAKAWPQICTLRLSGSRYRGPPSRVTLGGLSAVARHCPRLMYLATPFDASVVPDEGAVLANAELQWLDVEDAVLLEVIDTSRQGEVAEEVRERADHLHALWKEVEKLHPTARARAAMADEFGGAAL
ncbi:hypothetical protein MSAN_00309400 [Mycena sanguinolenta]|uniref:F-box domain-containing protein n=1 Tax=Mycena sanguinolenta TaxID=230812 RepID=A0A8H6ZB38_9AGAR|nr:hypothetical protein MSAN_00309400 [Mycena sanguinolenta]